MAPEGEAVTVLTPSAAIASLRNKTSVRVYEETAALKLLGIEDKYGARLEWKKRLGTPVLDSEQKTLSSVRDELGRRGKDELEEARAEFTRRNKIWSYFPDKGPYRRELYPRHMEFIGYTRTDNEVMMMAANKVGKSQLGAMCISCWTTGRYPKWWHGLRFEYPVSMWVCNKTAKDCRDINELELLGPPGNEAERGTGMLPGHLIQKCTPKPGTPNAFEFINVEHVSGATSYITTKSYDQGRTAFQGRNQHGIWNDEEVDKDIYGEEMLRVMIVDLAPGVKGSGIIINTYTPIQGLTDLTTEYMESAGLSIEALRRAANEHLEAELALCED
jgi:phage terminase large subunit-like protein